MIALTDREPTVAEKAAYIRNLKNDVPCWDCGIAYPYYVMQFDHVTGAKLFNLSEGPRRSMSEIDEEASKCQIVCSNCHAERTFNRQRAC